MITDILSRRFQQKIRHGYKKGAALVISLLFLLILSVLAISALNTTTLEEKMTSNQKLGIEAQLAAETGARDGITKIMDATITDTGNESSTTWSVNRSVSGMPSGVTADYTVSHRTIGGSVANNSAGKPFYMIQSTGTAGGITRTVEVVVSFTYEGSGVFANAMVGCEGVALSSNATTNSYSSSGQASTGDNGDVFTVNPNANITLDANVDINGDVDAMGNITMDSSAHIAKNAAANGNITLNKKTTTIGGNATAGGSVVESVPGGIGGTSTSNAGTPVASQSCDPLDVDQMVTDASNLSFSSHPAFGGTNYNMSSNATDTFTAGNYDFTNFSTSSNTVVTIDGDVVFYVDGDFSFFSNSDLQFNTGATLTIYVTGNVTAESNTCLNYTGTQCAKGKSQGAETKNLQIYSNASSTSATDYKVNFNSATDLYGVVYAPKAAMDFNSNATIHGAIRAKWVNMDSNAVFSYDEDLVNVGAGAGNTTITDHSTLYWGE